MSSGLAWFCNGDGQPQNIEADSPQHAGQQFQVPRGQLYFPPDRMAYWLSYNGVRGDIRRTWTHLDIKVPDVALMKAVGSNVVEQAVVWQGCTRMVFPDIDYVIVTRPLNGPLGLFIKETGVVPFDIIHTIMGGDLERLEDPVVHYVPKRSKPRRQSILAIGELVFTPLCDFTAVDPTSF